MFCSICKPLSAAPSVSFNQSAYIANKGSESVQLVLILSNPSSIDITVEVINTDTGKQLILYQGCCTVRTTAVNYNYG